MTRRTRPRDRGGPPAGLPPGPPDPIVNPLLPPSLR
jgi:hypothetical protein